MLVVAGALVVDGRVLAGRRRSGGWEFPGGKVEAGEALGAALEREWREELGADVEAVRELGIALDGELELRLWLARLLAGTPAIGPDHDELRWLDAGELDGLDWLPVDRLLLGVIRGLLRTRTTAVGVPRRSVR